MQGMNPIYKEECPQKIIDRLCSKSVFGNYFLNWDVYLLISSTAIFPPHKTRTTWLLDEK
jgi:hypothetical protein